MKRLLPLLLSIALVISLIPAAFAATPEAIEAANALYSQGLFNGTGKDANGNPIFELDRAPMRHEAITMLVRLLGKESEAQAGTWTTPFTDVAGWAKPYVGYAYTNGFAAGTSATTFSGEDAVSASEYLTFVLRTLGYSSGTDFQWDRAWELSDRIGLTDGRYNANTVSFTRGDVAVISNKALDTQCKNGNLTLRQTLPTKNVPNNIPEQQKTLLLDAYCEKMYYVALSAVYMQAAENAAAQRNMPDFLNYITAVRKSYHDECTALEKMKAICGDYTDTAELKKCIEEDIRIKSMGPEINNSAANASEFLSIISDSSYSAAYRKNVDAMKIQMNALFSESVVNNAVNQYIEQKIADMK